MPTYRHSGSETMFRRFRRTRSHQPGFAERFRRRTLLFIAFVIQLGYYTSKRQFLSILLWYSVLTSLLHVTGTHHRHRWVSRFPCDRFGFFPFFFFFHFLPSLPLVSAEGKKICTRRKPFGYICTIRLQKSVAAAIG